MSSSHARTSVRRKTWSCAMQYYNLVTIMHCHSLVRCIYKFKLFELIAYFRPSHFNNIIDCFYNYVLVSSWCVRPFTHCRHSSGCDEATLSIFLVIFFLRPTHQYYHFAQTSTVNQKTKWLTDQLLWHIRSQFQ